MMNLISRSALALAVVASAFAVTPEAQGSIFTASTDGQSQFSGLTVGVRFTVGASDIIIDELGAWVDSDGLQNDHIVSVWQQSGAKLVGGTVTAGTAADADGFAYVSIASTTLLAGTTYELGVTGYGGADFFGSQSSGSGALTPNGVTIVNDMFALSPADVRPNSENGDDGDADRATANARGPSAAIPEPSTLGLITLGAVVGLVRRRRG